MPLTTLSDLTARRFESLFLEYRSAFVRRAYRFTREREIAEDIVSDSFMAFWESRHTLPADTNIPAYIFTTVKNRCLNYLRDKATHSKAQHKIHTLGMRLIEADIASLAACDPDKLFSEEIVELLNHALEKMPPQTREVFRKSRFEDMTYDDIAREMGISPSYVHLEIRRGLQVLRVALKDYLIVLILAILNF